MQSNLKKNSILNIIKTCSSIIFPLITFPYVSRVLLPNNIGKVNFAQSYVSYFSLIAALGLSTYAVRECAIAKSDKNELSNISSQLFSINLLTTLFAYILLFFSLVIYGPVEKYRYLIIIESMVIIATTLGADWLNSAMEDYTFITIRTIAFQILSLVLMFIFVKCEDDYYRYAIISIISSAGASITNIWYRKRYCNVKFTLHIDWKKHLQPIFYLFVMQLTVTIFNNADITMIGLVKGDYEVGLYGTAYKVTRIISQVVTSVGLVIIPRLTYFFTNNEFEKANKLLRKVLGFNLTLGLPCVVGVVMLANEIIYFIGGIEYSDATPIIRVLMLNLLFSLIGGCFLGNAILIPMKNEKYYMKVCCIAALTNISLNVLVIPSMGATGAALTTAFNAFLIMMLLMIKVDKRIKIDSITRLFIIPLAGCVSIVFTCLGCKRIDNLLIRTICSVLFSGINYCIIQILLKNELLIEIVDSIKIKFRRKRS